MKNFVVVTLVASTLALSPMVCAEVKVLSDSGEEFDMKGSVGRTPTLREMKWLTGAGLRRWVLCVEGLKFFQTVGPGWGRGADVAVNLAVSTVQVYEERKGKVMPAKCK